MTPTATPLVFVHGGTFAGSCWDLVLAHLDAPSLAVDLPGRGAHPAPPHEVTIAAAAASVAADVDAAGFDEVVLVGHSLAGCSLPAATGLLGPRVRHVVFIACTVPEHGQSALHTLPVELHETVRQAHAEQGNEPSTMDPELARAFFGNDLSDEQFAWCQERMVPEGLGLIVEPVDLTPLRSPLPRTWVRPLRDAIVDPERQLEFAANVGDCPVVDIDAGHMVMVSKPAELAAILQSIAEAPLGKS